MDNRLDTPWIALRLGIGLTATLAGIDKFFSLLADWASYVSPAAAQFLPVSTATFLGIVGVVELAVGVAILTGWTGAGGYVASAWLLGSPRTSCWPASTTSLCETSSWHLPHSPWRASLRCGRRGQPAG